MFRLPDWIHPHLYPGKTYDSLTESEISELKARIAGFKDEAPEVSVMIPAWNEENNIFRSLSSLAANKTKYRVEIVVINNNSTDRTQQLLDTLGVRSLFQPEQGTPLARQMGLEHARGKYHLCADSDTLYPPNWIDLMVAPMEKDPEIKGVYGRYSFIPPEGYSRFSLWLYETVTGLLVFVRKKRREHLNVLGFNMGFVTKTGLETGGFKVSQVRKFDNAADSDYFVLEAEDGRMALNLKKQGRLKLVTNRSARVYTSPRRLMYDGSIWKAFKNRLKAQFAALPEYFAGKKHVE